MPLKMKSVPSLQPLLDWETLKHGCFYIFWTLLKARQRSLLSWVGPDLLNANTPDRLSFNVHSSVKSLGVCSENCFKLNRQISSVIKSSFFQLRLVAKNKAYLPPRDLQRTIHAFITSCLDYCMSLCVGLDQSSVQHLQLVHNAAARLLTGKRKRVHITPLLWFPMFFVLMFLCFTFHSCKTPCLTPG